VGLASFVRAIKRPNLWSVWLATLIFSGLVGVFMAFATVTAGDHGMENPANIWLTYALGACAIRALGARLPDRIGPANIIAPALATYVAAALLLASATTTAGFMWAGLLAGLGHGYCFPVLSSQVVTRMPDSLRGSGLAMFTALWGASTIAASPLMGIVADDVGDSAMFALAGLAATAGLTVWLFLEHRFSPD
jgi:MFS family permease